MSLVARVWLLCALVAGLGSAVQAAGSLPLASHLAVYDIKLKKASTDSGVADVSGRLVVEITGSACDGWSVGFRMVNRFIASDGADARLIDLQSTSWESEDGRELNYTQREFLNNALDSELKVKATHPPGADVDVQVRHGDSQTQLPSDVVFPMAHQRRLIAAAVAGQARDRSVVYDGSEGDKYYTAITFIGPMIAGENSGTLAHVRSWPMTIAYYDPRKQSDAGEDMPAHQISMRLYENGVSSELVLDYGNLQLTGKLAEMKLGQQKACP
jgi:hypothetical protein